MTQAASYVIASRTAANQATTFAAADTKSMFQLQLYQLMIIQSYCNH